MISVSGVGTGVEIEGREGVGVIVGVGGGVGVIGACGV